MRRDVCYFFSADVVSVYNSYMAAATNSRFRRNCNQEPYHTISFGLNFSVKYNMNGGACTLHFIPYNGGTAVDLRFSIAQVTGARYEKYAKDLTSAAMDVLGVPAQLFNLNIDEFLKENNKVTAQTAVPSPTEPPIAPFTPLGQPAVSVQPSTAKICAICGAELSDSDLFCSTCGTKVEQIRHCPNCGKEVEGSARFCSGCGSKL